MRNAIEQATSVVCQKKSSIIKYTVPITVMTLLFVGLCGAQTQFLLTVGGAYADEGNSVALTSDGGYVVTGQTQSFGAGHFALFLTKFNSSGDLTWAKTVGGASLDGGNSVVQTLDGGYIVTGETRSFGAGYYDLFLVKFNSLGKPTWAKTVGGTSHDLGFSVALTSDGGYIVTGATWSFFSAGDYDLFLVKFNSSGDLIWAKTVGGTWYDRGHSVTQSADGGYVVTGETRSFGTGEFALFLVKFNSSGDLIWAKTVGEVHYNIGLSIAQTSDGGYVVTGETGSSSRRGDLFLVKFNSSGDLIWAKTVGGVDGDYGSSVVQTSDGGYVVAGGTHSFGAGSYDLFLTKFNSSGDLIWAKTVGGISEDWGYSVASTPDGGYIITGKTHSFGAGFSDLFLVKFSSSGEIWDCSFVSDCSPVVRSCTLSSVSVSPIINTLSLSAVSCSPTLTNPSPTVTEVCTDISEVLSKPISFELTVSPNPFNSSCAITTPACVTVEIFDLHGRLIWNKPSDSDKVGATSLIKGGKPEAVPINNGDVAQRQGVSASAQGIIIWQPEEAISSGVYLVRATTDGGHQITKRIVYLK